MTEAAVKTMTLPSIPPTLMTRLKGVEKLMWKVNVKESEENLSERKVKQRERRE